MNEAIQLPPTSDTATAKGKGSSVQRMVRRLACKCGLHAWEHHADYFIGVMANQPVTLGWKQCNLCYTTKLKWIFRG